MWLIVGIISIFLGILLFRYSAKYQGRSVIERPLIFSNSIFVVVLNLLWIFLIGFGLYSLWQINYWIVLFLVLVYLLLWVVGFLKSRFKNKAKKIFKTYKKIKLYRPELNERDIFKRVAIDYYENMTNWSKTRVDGTVEGIFENYDEINGIKEIAKILFTHEKSTLLNERKAFSVKSSLRRKKKIDEAIAQAYEDVFEFDDIKITEELKNDLKKAGYKIDKMSDEQIKALAGMVSAEGKHWLSRYLDPLWQVGIIWALIELITLDMSGFIVVVIIVLVIMFISFRLQRRYSHKKFKEASISKFTSEDSKD